LRNEKTRDHFHHSMFHGFDFDNTMLRIGSMNMLLHSVENPDVRYRDSPAQDHAGEESPEARSRAGIHLLPPPRERRLQLDGLPEL